MTIEEKLRQRPEKERFDVGNSFLVDFQEYQGLFEEWFAPGVKGKRIVLLEEQVGDQDDEALVVDCFRRLLKEIPDIYIIRRESGYIYIQFEIVFGTSVSN